jgi:CheY-like chemotaxis protein
MNLAQLSVFYDFSDFPRFKVKEKESEVIKPTENKKILAPIKVLVVEDDRLCQKIDLIMLNQPNYQADLAINGQEALAKYQQGYDVILLDLGLPDINGIEVCRIIRQQKHANNIPIIALSAIGDLKYAECLATGFNEVLLKPCSREDLYAVIDSLVL